MSAAALMALAGNPRLCPCCWPNQGLEQESENTEIFTQSRGPCPANCMPFVATVDAPNDWLNYDGLTCRDWTVLNDTGSPTYTPIRHKSWPSGDWSGVYLTKTAFAPNGICSYQYGQYCTADEAGNRGRAWVVELWIWDGTTMHNLNTKILDWECRCYDATWGADGSRFTWSLTGDIPDCTADVCEGCAYDCLDVEIPPMVASPGSGCNKINTTNTVPLNFSATQCSGACGYIGSLTISGSNQYVVQICKFGTGWRATVQYSNFGCPTKTALYDSDNDTCDGQFSLAFASTWAPATINVTGVVCP